MKKQLCALALIATSLSACGKSGEETAMTYDGDGNATEVTTSDAGVKTKNAIAETELQSGEGTKAKLPAYAPLYPGAKVTNATNMNMGGRVTATVDFETSDPPEKVAAFYREAMQKSGHKIAQDITIPGEGEVALEGKRDNGDNWTVSADPKSGGGSVIGILTMEKR